MDSLREHFAENVHVFGLLLAFVLLTAMNAIEIFLHVIRRHDTKQEASPQHPKILMYLALAVLAILAGTIATLGVDIDTRFKHTDAAIATIGQRQAAAAALTQDSTLRFVFAPLLSEMAENTRLLPDQQVKYSYGNRFPVFYRLILRRYWRHHLYAVSYPWMDHVWGDKENLGLPRDMREFRLLHGGEIDRIFIVNDPDAIQPKEWTIIAQHIANCVEVRTIGAQQVGTVKPLLVADDKSFAWITELGPNNSVETLIASTNREKNEDFYTQWQELAGKARAITMADVPSKYRPSAKLGPCQ